MITGKYAENLATVYFADHGFVILHRNYRFSHYEIDIIAIKDDVLHVIEVKSLTSDEIIDPETHVTKEISIIKESGGALLVNSPSLPTRPVRYPLGCDKK